MMTNMKHILTLAIIALSALCSCSLQEESESFVNREQYYQTEAQCDAAVKSCYANLKNIYSYKLFVLTETHTDIIGFEANTVTESRMEISPAQPGIGEDIWRYCYQMIMFTNTTIAGIEGSPISDKKKASLIAETKVMRALYYWLLTSLFGDVPFYTEAITPENEMHIATLPRMSAVATRSFLIHELTECVAELPAVKTSEIEGNRAGAAVAQMLIAKMAMWNAAYDEKSNTDWYGIAIGALLQLDTIYGQDLSLYPLEDIKFRHKNTPESIFEIQHHYTAGGLVYTSSLSCICTPTVSVNSETKKATFAGLTIPEDEIGNDASTWAAARPNIFYSSGLMTRPAKTYTSYGKNAEGKDMRLWNGDFSGDLRAELNMAWEYPYDTTVTYKENDVTLTKTGIDFKQFNGVSERPWMGPKFWCPGQRDTYDSNNYKVFRYADAVLMLAECYCVKGDTENALKYLNMVKRRAQIAECTLTDTGKLMEEIQDERGRELFGEFQRKFDLVRWGVWFERVKAYNNNAQLLKNVRPCHEFMPIPDKQVIYSGYALDNKEYNKYGM